MNKTYKVVWNDALGLFQVVNELTRGRRKSAGHGESAEAVQSAAPAIKLFRKGLMAAALSSLFITAGPVLAADLTITGLVIGTTDTTAALTTEALPAAGETIILSAPNANTGNLFLQDTGIDYKVSDTNLTINADQITKPADATIDLGTDAKGVYEFNLAGTSGGTLTLNANLKELQLLDGQTFTLVRSPSDPASFTAIITGTGNLKTEGDMKLSGVNTYTGKTEIATGTVTMGSDAAFGASKDLTVNDAAVLDMAGKNLTLEKLAGTGTVNVNNGTLTLNLTSADPNRYLSRHISSFFSKKTVTFCHPRG